MAGLRPVTADTIFSVQSMSKLFTATAVMQAVAAGRLDLDEPITTYLPGFTVHSAFEAHPERKITLRMLLSHTAGFTHEAPVGNNYELDPGDFDAHVRSISDTWLRFPVGTGYAYSNLGIDLAGYILERVEGKPFADVMRDSLLAPLGMDHSTFDRAEIRATADRAVGHSTVPEPPLDEPMTAAGGLYASAADLARFLRFQLNDGTIDGRTVLGPTWLDEMRTVPAPHAGAPAGYALGVVRTAGRGRPYLDLFNHGGGGFGFLSDLWWLPQLQLGIAVLTNSADHDLQGDARAVDPHDLVSEPGVYHDRLLALPWRPTAADAILLRSAGRDGRPRRISAGSRRRIWPPAGPDTPAATAPRPALPEPHGPPARFLVDAGVPYFDADDDGSAGSSPADRNQARPVSGRQRRDARPAGAVAHLAEPSARSRLGQPLPMAVGAPRDIRARRPPCGLSPRPVRTIRRSPRLAFLLEATANRDAPLAPGRGAGGECDRAARARKRRPARVGTRARRHRVRRRARPVPG